MNTPQDSPEKLQEALEVFKEAIARVYASRELLKLEMEIWYEDHPGTSFPRTRELIDLDEELSDLDDRFKQLWDETHKKH